MKSALTYIGVDPGTTGAIAVIHGGTVATWPIPMREVKRDGRNQSALDTPALCRLARILADLEPAGVAIEDVWLAGGDNVVSGGKLMFISGALEAAFVAAGVPVRRVAPMAWKGALGCAGAGVDEPNRRKKRALLKTRARETAARLFPGAATLFARVKDADAAEATLIAEWLRRQQEHGK